MMLSLLHVVVVQSVLATVIHDPPEKAHRCSALPEAASAGMLSNLSLRTGATSNTPEHWTSVLVHPESLI